MMKVITANTLKTGEVVFLGPDRWVSDLNQAALFDQDEDLDQIMKTYDQADHVMGLYAIHVEVKANDVTPHHIREKIRATGPGNYDHQRVRDIAPMRY